jgi:hypothetical protein
MTHDVIGPAMRKSRKEGLHKGLQEGELTILRRLIAKRFGSLPARLDKKPAKLSRPALEALSHRVFDAKTIDDLFAR